MSGVVSQICALSIIRNSAPARGRNLSNFQELTDVSQGYAQRWRIGGRLERAAAITAQGASLKSHGSIGPYGLASSQSTVASFVVGADHQAAPERTGWAGRFIDDRLYRGRPAVLLFERRVRPRKQRRTCAYLSPEQAHLPSLQRRNVYKQRGLHVANGQSLSAQRR